MYSQPICRCIIFPIDSPSKGAWPTCHRPRLCAIHINYLVAGAQGVLEEGSCAKHPRPYIIILGHGTAGVPKLQIDRKG